MLTTTCMGKSIWMSGQRARRSGLSEPGLYGLSRSSRGLLQPPIQVDELLFLRIRAPVYAHAKPWAHVHNASWRLKDIIAASQLNSHLRSRRQGIERIDIAAAAANVGRARVQYGGAEGLEHFRDQRQRIARRIASISHRVCH